MSECQVCHCEDSTFNRFCKDCWIEMIREAKSAGNVLVGTRRIEDDRR